jgi:hypothetical protein
MSMVRRSVESGDRRRKSRDALTSRPEIERLLDAARAPASPRELAGEREAVDLFARARLDTASAPPREVGAPTRSVRTGLKAALAAAGAVGVLSSGIAFAATGHVPLVDKVISAARHLPGVHHPTPSEHGLGPKGDSATPGDQGDKGTSKEPKPAQLHGLCRAYTKGQKATHGHALENGAFTRLVKVAGGPDQVEAYCASLPPKTHQGGPGPSNPTQGTPSDEPSDGNTHPAHPTHPTHPTHPSHPAHPSHPTQGSSPTKKPHPTHPTKKPHPTHPTHPTKKPHPEKPTQAG